MRRIYLWLCGSCGSTRITYNHDVPRCVICRSEMVLRLERDLG